MSVAGPMDPVFASARERARRQRRATTPTLEVTLVGPELEFEDERVVAVAGAEFELTVDGRPVADGRAVRRSRRIAPAVRAARGAARAPTSRSPAASTCRRCSAAARRISSSAMGGLDGRALRRGRSSAARRTGASRPDAIAARRQRYAAVGALPDGPRATSACCAGPHAGSFRGRRARRPAVGAVRDRPRIPIAWDSGSRAPRARARARTRRSSPTRRRSASLQVPASGQPILLMADRQTTGGYPKIATVITADIGVAGQLAPGDSISFVVCSPRRGAGGADRAGARADGARGVGPADERLRRRCCATRSADRVRRAACRSRR